MEGLQSWFVELAAVIAMAVVALYVYFKITYTYWEKRGVATVKPTVPFGNFAASIISGVNPAFEMIDLYNAFKGQKIGGLYKLSGPSLLLLDPEIIKDVLVKDFDHFFSRGRVFDDEFEPLDGHLFSLSGTKWRNLRVKLTPIFTSKKMKMMFGAVLECGRDLQESLQKSANSAEAVEIHDYLARYSTDVISSCAFGIQCNCLKNPEAEFRQWGRRIFEPHFRQRMTSLLQIVYPSLVYTFKLSLVPRDVSNYFQRMVRETVEYRESNNVERSDFMQLMIQLKNKTLSIAEEEDLKSLEKQTHGLKSNAPFGEC
jgi:cytochrome P450 family 6